MPGTLTTLLNEIHAAVDGHDWTAELAGGADVEKKWKPNLATTNLHATKPTITVAPGDLLLQRVDAVSFDKETLIAVAVRGRAATDERNELMCDFAEAVGDFLTTITTTSLPIVEAKTQPLVHLDSMREHNVWFTLFLISCGLPTNG